MTGFNLVWLLTVMSPSPLSRCCKSFSSVDWLVILVEFHQFSTNFPVSETMARVNTLPNSPHGGLMIGSSGSRVESMHAVQELLVQVAYVDANIEQVTRSMLDSSINSLCMISAQSTLQVIRLSSCSDRSVLRDNEQSNQSAEVLQQLADRILQRLAAADSKTSFMLFCVDQVTCL